MFAIQTRKNFLIEPLKLRLFPITVSNCASWQYSPGAFGQQNPHRWGWMQH